ncbi:hypothetical protein IDJ77_23175 [Mucilaginibacter sp. ZT4R22]|uniref:BNR repeat protein n=1 Tax=Mucilaginibacter pankratovii TaxID=2772110 RepID=A0ABR7WWS1_9SPHI|nr:hypothetical protein [Mucilaginibacter pankratovii]MBD1366733.1 hypothetical protein [Mucilaginibacter pankratovii]
MRNTFGIIFSVIIIACIFAFKGNESGTIAPGQQPQIAVDNKGVVRVVYGDKDKIFCVTSVDGGASFTAPVLVATVPNMHLGMARGPQVTSSLNYTVITAMDKAGAIHWFRQSHATGKWSNMGTVNDKTGSAPEGLMSIAADKADNFYAVWLDIRTGGNNQVYFSSLSSKSMRWTKNTMAYQSPDGHVCECCKPNIAVNGSEVAIMFRNWLMGSRDLYVARSANGGKTFGAAQKLGLDTWKLNACTMDGGGILLGDKGAIYTTWQRKGGVYFAKAGQPETFIAKGRNCDISGTGDNLALTYQQNDTVKMVSLKSKQTIAIDKGAFLQASALPHGKTLCVWEQAGTVKFKVL